MKSSFLHISSRLAFGWILLIGLAACQTDDHSRINTDVKLQVNCSGDSVRADGQGITWSDWDSITVRAIGSDSVIYNNRKDISSLFLPLRQDANLTQFILDYHNLTDTLSVYYSNRQMYISLASGAIVCHEIESVHITSHWAYQSQVINANVTNSPIENIRIYTHK